MKGIELKTFKTREEWLKARAERIGGSDASAIIGTNPWKNNLQLFEEKTNKDDEPEETMNTAMLYGTKAESPLRELFALDFPEYKVFYEENNMWLNEKYPFAHYSSDGWLEDSNGRRGVFECKTTTINSSTQENLWKGQIPDYYYAQVLHEMAVYDADFAVLKAQLKFDYEKDGERVFFTKSLHYFFERSDVQEDIEYLMNAEKYFWDCVQSGVEPSTVLPSI